MVGAMWRGVSGENKRLKKGAASNPSAKYVLDAAVGPQSHDTAVLVRCQHYVQTLRHVEALHVHAGPGQDGRVAGAGGWTGGSCVVSVPA